MAGFVRRFTSFPSIEVLTEIEAINIVDLPPPTTISGVGAGTLLMVGEFEDGPFAAGGDATEYARAGEGPIEVFGSTDLRAQFGGFGFQYTTTPAQNPCARRHLGELWNGSGYVHLKYAKPKRLIIARVDTSVGSVAFSPLAMIEGAVGPYDLAVGQTVSFTSSTGGPTASTAVAATRATAAGAAGVFPTLFAGGETITIAIDGGPAIPVVFAAADQTAADVVARINDTLGFTSAVLNAGQVDIRGLVFGTDGEVVLADVTAGTLATIGHAAGTTAGTGNVGNVDAATAAEVAAIINGTAGLVAIDVAASVGPTGTLRVRDTNPGTGTILVAAGAMATALGLEAGVTVAAGEHEAGTIPAGTRVRTAGGTEWVTLQTLTVEEGTSTDPNPGPHVVKVRPALDDGTDAGTGAATVTTVADQPDFAELSVTNAAALTAALTEVQLDVAYRSAFDATLDLTKASREANISLSARQSDSVRAVANSNADDASEQGCFGREYIARAPIGFTQAQAQAQRAALLSRGGRTHYTWPGWQVQLPEIALVGAAGGLGFNDTGIITIGADAALASIMCQLNPEENPGQATGLIEQFFAVEATAARLGIVEYTALRAAGIAAPRRDRVSGSIYQSGVTLDADAEVANIARRHMADFIQDSLATALVPYSKKLGTQARKDGIRAAVEQFLGLLKSEVNRELARIDDFSVEEVVDPNLAARGIFVLNVLVRTLSSLDAIVLQTQVGEGVVVVREAA